MVDMEELAGRALAEQEAAAAEQAIMVAEVAGLEIMVAALCYFMSAGI